MASKSLDSFLPIAFRTFFHEASRVEREIRGKLAQDAAALALEPPAQAATFRKRLEKLLEQQKNDAQSQRRDPEAVAFQQSQYVMAAAADAILDFPWWGRQDWADQPLTDDYQVPDGVEQEIPEQIEALLSEENPDPELAQIYLLALGTGAVTTTDTTASARLFKILSTSYPELAGEPPKHLFPEAYRRQQRRGTAALLPAERGWRIAVLVVVAILLTASAPLWLRATAAARQAVEQILASE